MRGSMKIYVYYNYRLDIIQIAEDKNWVGLIYIGVL